MTGDRTPTGDLRERLAQEIHLHCPSRPYGGNCRCTALADAVLPVVEAETAALRQRAEEAERERDKARDAIADERRGRPLDIAKEVQETLEALLPHLQGEHMRDLWHANDLMSELIERLEDER